ncbi:MAG: hypothetical protein RLZZ367_15 [Bacteroidota bacterium]|jgi:hypothetical protein
MLKKLLSILPVLMVLYGTAQTTTPAKAVPIEQQKLDALKGTYEIRTQNPRIPYVLPSNLAEIIEKNRKEREATQLQLNENVLLIIYPKKSNAGAAPAKQ